MYIFSAFTTVSDYLLLAFQYFSSTRANFFLRYIQ